MPGGARIFPEMTLQGNLGMGAYVRGHAGAGPDDLERVFHYFPRLKERARQLGGTLSCGEQQMLAIARALMSNPRLLLLDHGGHQAQRGLVEMADRAYVMEGGRIALEGADLLDNADVRRAYLGG